MKDYKNVITDTIKCLGISAGLKGFRYVRYAVELMMKDISLMDAMMSKLYPAVAKEFDTTPTRAERAIRYAVEFGWNRANSAFAHKLFGYSVDANKGKPTNTEFIVTVSDYILMNDGKEDEGN